MEQVKIKKQSESSIGMTKCCDSDYYPYGTQLSFEDDIIDELDIGGLAVGDVVEIKGYAIVDSKSENSNKEMTNKTIRFQMTSVAIEREDDDRVTQMYGS